MLKYFSSKYLCLFSGNIFSEQKGTGLIDKVTADHRSLVQLQLTDLSDRDSGITLKYVKRIEAGRI